MVVVTRPNDEEVENSSLDHFSPSFVRGTLVRQVKGKTKFEKEV